MRFMEIKRAAIKKNAKLLIATTRPSPILVFLVYILIGLVLLYLSESISGAAAGHITPGILA